MCSIDVLYTCQDDDVPPILPAATIIEACNNAPKTELGCVPTTLMFSSELVIKHVRVTLEECRNQVRAYELLDPSIVVVPKVYRYFSHNDNIYLVMQRIHGQVRKRVEDLQSVRRIADIIRHLQTHKSNIPGPLGGGISRGLWWENEDADLRGEVARFAEYIKRRLKGPQQGWTFDMGEFVMNHNDIAPRNIIWMPDGSISLIDWAHAGFYPWLLELAILEFNTDGTEDLGFTIPLIAEFEPLSEADQKNKASLQMAWFNGHRYPV
ncbi:unnamed protein product [Aureobasidium mustum]|uniref:Aminoglycoside phosphotransferase domain-containing protein n=1 Tax=Aureobasidium mustum TaxID=2773714 RepID=A0A9N8PLD6_9PEZI|nr:unnamed protein product [Aureobasidium mustum]